MVAAFAALAAFRVLGTLRSPNTRVKRGTYRLSGMGFSTPSYDLTDLIARIKRGDIQLPDFQREYSWDEDRIRALIVTVLRGYPMGALMALDTRNEVMRFRPRPIAGAPDTGVNPGLLLLDGQQRLTTIYHCFTGTGSVETVDFRDKRINRTFFVDVLTAVEEELLPDEAVFAVDRHGRVRSHFGPDIDGNLHDREVARQHKCIPVADLLSEAGTKMIFDLVADGDDSLREKVAAFHSRVMLPLAGYNTPMIRLSRETARAGVGSIFAQANSAGLQMDVFDLLTAVFASEDENFHLARVWEETERELRKHPALDGIDRNAFLSAVSLLVTGERGHAGGQREDILNLTLEEFRAARDTLVVTFREVASFLNQRCMFELDQVPYSAQIVPLAVILARLANRRGVLSKQESWDRINQWFWCGVFGELYGSSAVKLRSARDVDEVTEWVAGNSDELPKTIADASFSESRLLSADSTTGVYHAIYALLMARGAKDWRSGQPFNSNTIAELHPGFYQVFPAQWCAKNGIEEALADSVLNRTPMGKRTEVVTDGYSPGRYLARVQSKSLMEDKEFDAVLSSHDLDVQLLYDADAWGFFRDRRQRFIDIVEHAMGKSVERDVNDNDLSAGEEGPNAFGRA